MLSDRRTLQNVRGIFFNDMTKRILLYERSLCAKSRLRIVSTADRTEDDVLILFELDRTYKGHSSPQIFKYVPFGSFQASLINWKNKPMSLCFIPIETFQERCRCDIIRRMLSAN